MSLQRRSPAIPLSPSSPPESGLKQRQKRRLSEEFQQYPSTPPLMSIATKSYAPSYENAQSLTDQMSSSGGSSRETQVTQPPSSSFATSATSASPPSSNIEQDGFDRHRDKRRKTEADQDGRDLTEGSASYTNHDRHTDLHHPRHGPSTIPMNDESRMISQREGGQMDVSKDEFHLRRTRITRSYPDPKNHLLSRFGLIPLLKTVARNDPVTGEKIVQNKLRKSYEGQIKTFGLAGRNKAVKSDLLENEKRPLRALVEDISDGDWKQQHPNQSITPNSEFKAKLVTAMQLQPGTVRNNSHWEDVLGHERTKPSATPQTGVATNSPTLAANVSQTNGVSRPQGRTSLDVIRPRRTGKKRSYGDNSFEGYGDGFEDDDFEDAGAQSDRDGDAGGSVRRKRRKDHYSINMTFGGP